MSVQLLKESPEVVQMSLAAAMVLGLQGGRFYRDVTLGCVNLLLTYEDGCRANCTYCGLARERTGNDTFIRVAWPTYSTEQVLRRLQRRQERVGRICLSMVQHPKALGDTLELVGRIRAAVATPISMLINPHGVGEDGLSAFKTAGVDIVGVAIDAASQEVFEKTRGRAVASPLRWDVYWRTMEAARRLFGPWRVNCHVVVGLGETDYDLVQLFGKLREAEIASYLFSFYPEPGSEMEKHPRPNLRRWRRLQLLNSAIGGGLLEPRQCTFDSDGRLVGIEAREEDLEGLVAGGRPFMTDGCPDQSGQVVCTRPFGSYRPGESFRDFPFRPTESDLKRVRRELKLDRLVA
jgi:biotin synthase